ncbi:hypothetical protein Aasi_1417 [Sporocytophaga myxococcoides]|uniref:Virulence plasmid A protein n=1 Tax=Sporocytophaga myxococcoides TaxID=153721 RepID=A0A098LHP9_9BACT|nr:neuraminidase-like domain-containing protein [Sporocytophaga myxococcoides]GAL85663.1 hypothetical protein Aasi_1417 [Sporocytophaga myxococcoides]
MATILKNNTVVGTITDANNYPLPNLKIEIYDVDMRSWQLLSATSTNKEGKFEMTWSHEQLSGRGKKTADIAIKVLTSEKGIELYKSDMDDVRFNAGEREEINIILRQPVPKETVEFDWLVKEVLFLAGNVAIEDIQENKEHRDITFLSKELEQASEKLEHLVVAHRLQKLTSINADFFYGIFRKGTLLQNDFGGAFKARHSISLGDDDKILLFDIALTDTNIIETDLKAAVQENLTGVSVLRNLSHDIEVLQKFKRDAEAYYEKEHSKRVIELVTKLLDPVKVKEVEQLLFDNKNDLNTFFDKVSDPDFFERKGATKESNLDDSLNKFFNFSKEAVAGIVKEVRIEKVSDVKKLARFNKAKWVEEIKKASRGSHDEKAINTYASAVVRRFEKAFPTVAFAAQLERSEKVVLKNQKEIVNFFNKHENFEFLRDHVDLYLKEKGDEFDSEAVADELKSIQRIFKLVPHYGKIMALRDEKIHSAFNIVSIGKSRFQKEIAPKAGLSEIEANEVFRKAETKNTAAMLTLGDLNDSISAMDIASLENASLVKKIETVSKEFPNLKSLFKLTDTCECEHCRSVHSPAAYLVEILQFLDKRTVVSGNAKSILFKRRPDLGEIDLGCENANTPVKYIDLVNEILEDAIAPDQGINFTGDLVDGSNPSKGKISNSLLAALEATGLPVTDKALIHETESSIVSPLALPHYLRDKKLVCKILNTGANNYTIYRLRQTMSSAEELDAVPEYVNTQAYDALMNSNFAFKLPFDLPHTEAKAYFERFGIKRADLMQTFQRTAIPSNETIASEYIGLADSDRQLIANTPILNDNAAQQNFWNVPSGNVIDYLKQVDLFLDRTGLHYKELELLLKLRFINKNGNLFIFNNDLTCDTATKEIKNLDLAVLDRIHRFIRLQRKLGWRFETLDEVISQAKLGNANLNDHCLLVISNIKKISIKTGLKVEELICCFGEIPHTLLPYQTNTLYDSIFQNKSQNRSVEPGLTAEKIIENETAVVKKQLTDFRKAISTCISIKEADFDKLVAALPNGELSFINLSGMYAIGKLMKKLKIKTDDFFTLKELTGIDVFNSAEDTLKFCEALEDAKKGSINVVDVKYILQHKADNLIDREIKPEKIKAMLSGIQLASQKSFNVNRSPYNDALTVEVQKETFKTYLSKLPVLNEQDVAILLNFLDSNWKYSWVDELFVVHNGSSSADAITFVDDKKIDTLFDVTAIKTAITNLNNAGPNAETEQKAFIKAWLEGIAAYLFEQDRASIINTALSNTFKTSIDSVDIVLSNAILKKTAPGTDLLIDVLQSNTLIDIADIDSGHPLPVLPNINKAAFSRQYAALRLLHKLLPLISALKLNNIQLEWFLKNAHKLGWFELDNIPFEPTQPNVPYQQYTEFIELLSLTKDLSPVLNPLDAENPISFFSVIELTLNNSSSQDELMQSLGLLTGNEKSDLIAVDQYFFAAFSPDNYKSITNLKRLLQCAESMRTLSANIGQITGFIKPVLNAADAADLRANLKTRYNEDTWLSTLKEIMDKIRPQKRDALVAYLLATNPDVKDENDLYEYFLVDVEMGACMPSSRIVLAHNSIQLFVQRCLMGLEPEAIANTGEDPDWNQWKWMKNYRVWEANRKIFLYPENWYDVTLADDKSFLLTDLINELQQNELTNDTAEESVKNYLEKLDHIAFLEVKATWYDVPSRTMHVFARTKGGDPDIYYYRRFESERNWTAWEKVDLDITGEQLLAFIRNNRLHLAWLIFSEESDPNQGAKLPNQNNHGEQPTDKPRKKLKIQLAISEFSNKKWQPKKVSKDCIYTPGFGEGFTYDLINKEKFNLIYIEFLSQIYVFSSRLNKPDFEDKIFNGIFDITGCKGYPEKVKDGNYELTDFLPDFSQARLLSQRYTEDVNASPDDLKVKNGISPFQFFKLFDKTPGQFRITYPHQLTIIDLISAVYQFIIILLLRKSNTDIKLPGLKIPFGTLLPYFMEDSWHAYVIIPGFYKEQYAGGEFYSVIGLTDDEKRTASDVFQLIDRIINWVKKIRLEFQDEPPANTQEAIDRIIADPDFQEIIQEMSHYKALQPLLQKLIGITDNTEFDEYLKKALEQNGLVYGEQFKNMYHPMVCALKTILYKDGISSLMSRETQLKINTTFDFKAYYNPEELHIAKLSYKQADGSLIYNYPIEDVDFTSDGSYSLYNWDLFYRIPLHIATSLTKNQRFEEALSWFHYMFNPTGALSGAGVQKYWVTKPFYLNQESDYIAQRIDSLMNATADKNNPDIKEMEFAIEQWRKKPFRPDVIARFRPVAYQKALLMKYIDNLTEWGDYLFRQDTMESIAQATQMYILADKLLGPKPRIVPPLVKQPYETYNQMEAKLDNFGNALIALENILPDLSALPEGGAELPPLPVTLSMLYFCIPQNEKMFEYWDRVADRLFKIRHCQNIDGIERSLALFAPPIDPGMLVKAAASGLDVSSILSGFNAPTPFYRFNVLSAKATELVQEVRGLGNSLLQALEKKDAEALSLLRNELELKVLNAVRDIKKLQIDEANEQIEVLKRTQKVTEERYKFYKDIKFMTALETTSLSLNAFSIIAYGISSVMEKAAGGMALAPTVTAGGAGLGGSPVSLTTILDGDKISNSIKSFAKAILLDSQLIDKVAGGISTVANYQRRYDDWKLQELLAEKELASIEKQIAAAEIRKEISESDLKNHDLQIENAKKTDEFMRSKYTNKELYDWMIGQISSVYYKSYQLAHDFAKKAERSYRFELGNDDSFISFGYWDSMKKGLQSADALLHDIKRMEAGYLDKNKREYEIIKHISLSQLDPLALIRLRATGVCDFEVPEVLYDMDYAGHYFRRIKSVSISLPCIAGPYTSVSAKLSLINNRYRKNINSDNAASTGYLEDLNNDERFMYNIGAIQSVATSNAQNDSGLFELNFRDERYLPFEGCGAISSWRLELPNPNVSKQFNYDTISDVILHMKYTAREGGSTLKGLAEGSLIERIEQIKQQLNTEQGFHIALNMKHDMPNEWHMLRKNKSASLSISKDRLPYFINGINNADIDHITFVAKSPSAITIKVNGTPVSVNDAEWGLFIADYSGLTLDNAFTLSIDSQSELDKLSELLMVVKIKLS